MVQQRLRRYKSAKKKDMDNALLFSIGKFRKLFKKIYI